MNYQHARWMSGGRKTLAETVFKNYWHDRCMSGEIYMFKTDRFYKFIDMISACQVKVKYFKTETGFTNY